MSFAVLAGQITKRNIEDAFKRKPFGFNIGGIEGLALLMEDDGYVFNFKKKTIGKGSSFSQTVKFYIDEDYEKLVGLAQQLIAKAEAASKAHNDNLQDEIDKFVLAHTG